MSKKKPAAAPWEVTQDMFLSELETESLLTFVRDGERLAPPTTRVRAATDRLIIELLLFSGLRNSELCRLRVVDTSIGHGQSAIQISGTPNQDRLVHVPRTLTDTIVHFAKQIRPECVAEGTSPTDTSQPLILNERSRPYDRTALYRRVVRILTEAGLEDRASVQLLRHTYGFLAYKRTGGNLLFVQRQLGHAHPMVTAVYAQFVPFSNSELADLVGETKSESPTGRTKRTSKTLRLKGTKR